MYPDFSVSPPCRCSAPFQLPSSTPFRTLTKQCSVQTNITVVQVLYIVPKAILLPKTVHVRTTTTNHHNTPGQLDSACQARSCLRDTHVLQQLKRPHAQTTNMTPSVTSISRSCLSMASHAPRKLLTSATQNIERRPYRRLRSWSHLSLKTSSA